MVSLVTSDNCYEIGSPDFLHSFFSTVAYHLEDKKWGNRYPCIMNDLYGGELPAEKIPQALAELQEICEKLKSYTPDKVIWDIGDLSKRPPWGDNISEDITDLSDYFVTSDGEDLIGVFMNALHRAQETGAPLKIEMM